MQQIKYAKIGGKNNQHELLCKFAVQVRRHLLKHLFGIMSSKSKLLRECWWTDKCLETNQHNLSQSCLQMSRVLLVATETSHNSISSRENESFWSSYRSTSIFSFHLKYEALTKEKYWLKSPTAACLLDLWAVTATESLCYHGLSAAGLFGCIFLLSLGPDEHHHHDDEEHREEQSDKEANDQHQAFVTVVPLVELTGDDAFGEDLPLRTRLPLATAVQRDVEDVGPTIVIHPDIFHYVWHIIGWSSAAMANLWNHVSWPAHHMVLHTSFPNTTVGVVTGTHSVDGVNVPLSPCRHLPRSTVDPLGGNLDTDRFFWSNLWSLTVILLYIFFFFTQYSPSSLTPTRKE